MLRWPAFLSCALVVLLGGLGYFLWPRPISEKSSIVKKEPAPAASLAEATGSAPIENKNPPLLSTRVPSAQGSGIAELERESIGPWNLKLRSDGYVKKMSEARFAIGKYPAEATAKLFLGRFARGLFGVSPENIVSIESRQESDSSQVISRQFQNGLPVFGSRINLIFDSDGNLIYATSDVYTGQSAPSSVPLISAQAAATVAQAALLRFLSLSGGNGAVEPYGTSFFLNNGHLAYRLVGASISLVYRYELSLLPLNEGDIEIMIDANQGAVVLIRNLTRR